MGEATARATSQTGGTPGAGGTGGAAGAENDSGIPDADASSNDAGDAGGCGAFMGLGDLAGGATDSVAHAISRDGTTVVGRSASASGFEAMRWRVESGMVGLGDLAGSSFDSRAQAVSGDGSVVVGVSHWALVDCAGRLDEAFRWTESGGMVALGDVSGGC